MTLCNHCKKEINIATTSYTGVDENRVVAFCSDKCKVKYFQTSNKNNYIINLFNYGKLKSYLDLGIIPQIFNFRFFRISLLGIVFILIPILLVSYGISLRMHHKEHFKSFVNLKLNKTGDFKKKIPLKIAKIKENSDQTIKYYEKSLRILESILDSDINTIWDFEAVEILARKGNTKAMNKLLTILKTGDDPRKRRAAIVLAKLGNPVGLIKLKKDLQSSKFSSSSLAAFALGQIGFKKSKRFLRQLMRFKQTKFSAAEAALGVGSEAAKTYLFYLSTKGKREGDRVRAAYALAKYGDKRVEKILTDALDNSSERYLAALGLASLGNKKVIPILKQAVQLISLRIEASKKLAHLGAYNSYKLMVSELESDYKPSKITAASAVFILTSGKISLVTMKTKGNMVKPLLAFSGMELWQKL